MDTYLNETSKIIEGYNNRYSITKNGQVLDHNKNKYLNIFKSNGYYAVNLNDGEQFKQVRIHRLLAEAFIPNPNNFEIVDHFDRRPLNNFIDLDNIENSNLRWVHATKNSQNRNKKQNATSIYMGVSKRENGTWIVRVNQKHIGIYDSELEAAKAYNLKAKEIGINHLNKL